MGHKSIEITTTPQALDDQDGFVSTQAYSIQCTGLGGPEEQKNLYEVRILLAADDIDFEADGVMDQAFRDAQILVPKGERFTYRQATDEHCYMWCQYGPSRVSYVETT